MDELFKKGAILVDKFFKKVTLISDIVFLVAMFFLVLYWICFGVYHLFLHV